MPQRKLTDTPSVTERVRRKRRGDLVTVKTQMMKSFVKKRLTLAADEIIELFERTIAEYEERLDIQRQKLLESEARLNNAEVQQLLVIEDVAPPEQQQQQWSSRMDQEGPEPPHIKEEQEYLWTSPEGAQLQGPEEAGIKFTSFPVKREEDDETSKRVKMEADGNDATSLSSESDTDDSRDWEETREPQSRDRECNSGKTSVGSSECARSFVHKAGTKVLKGSTYMIVPPLSGPQPPQPPVPPPVRKPRAASIATKRAPSRSASKVAPRIARTSVRPIMPAPPRPPPPVCNKWKLEEAHKLKVGGKPPRVHRPLCTLCGQLTQGHKKYKKKSFCPVKMMSTSKGLKCRVYHSYEHFTSTVDRYWDGSLT